MARERNSPPAGNTGGQEAAGGGGGYAAQATACPPRCALACAWPPYRELAAHPRFDAATLLHWALVGVGHDPLHPREWAAAIRTVAEAAGARAAALGLERAAAQPAIAPHRPGGRWWGADDRQRAAALATAWRRRAQHEEGVVA